MGRDGILWSKVRPLNRQELVLGQRDMSNDPSVRSRRRGEPGSGAGALGDLRGEAPHQGLPSFAHCSPLQVHPIRGAQKR